MNTRSAAGGPGAIVARVAALLCLAAWIAGIAQTASASQQVPPPNDRQHVRVEGDVRITTAVPSATETQRIFGAPLYRRNIQPVWVQVENLGDRRMWFLPIGLDVAYYTPLETASRSYPWERLWEQNVPKDFQDKSMGVMIEPRGIRSGYIFSRVDEGTKSFNVDVFPHGRSHYRMTFFVPVPGLRLDHYRVAFDELYAADEMVDLDMPGLIEGLESLPCCVTDKKGEHYGDPLNIAFVADIEDLYYAFLRAGWDETETIHRVSVWKTIRSAVSGANYRYSPVSPLYVFGRGQDAALQRARDSIHERNHLRIWLTPMRYEGTPVWIGQISRDIGVRLSAKTIFTHKIDPVVDETREFLIEDLAYTQSLEKFGYVQGVGAAPYELPRRNLTGDPYITDGLRAVMWVSDAVVSLDSLELLDLGAHPSTALPTAVPE